MYEYKCNLLRVVDACTVDAELDLGFSIKLKQTIKLHGVMTAPDSKSCNTDITLGLTSTQFLESLLKDGFSVRTIMMRRSRAGKVFGIIRVPNATVNQLMVDVGFLIKREQPE
jgi:hypothetical protein